MSGGRARSPTRPRRSVGLRPASRTARKNTAELWTGDSGEDGGYGVSFSCFRVAALESRKCGKVAFSSSETQPTSCLDESRSTT